MPDTENIIERLDKVSLFFKSMLQVGYDGDADIYREHRETVKMAIPLVKKQIPVSPALKPPYYRCGVCDKGIVGIERDGFGLAYCSACGQAVKWE